MPQVGYARRARGVGCAVTTPLDRQSAARLSDQVESTSATHERCSARVAEGRRADSSHEPVVCHHDVATRQQRARLMSAPSDDLSQVITDQYGDLLDVAGQMPARLAEVDAARNGGPGDVTSVGDALVEALALPRGSRPRRLIVDDQHKGVEQLDSVRQDKQRALFAALGIEDLLDTVSSTDSSQEEPP